MGLRPQGNQVTRPKRFDKDGLRYYPIPELGRDLRSVTSITGIIDKPAIAIWSANVAADYIKVELFDKIDRGEMTLDDIRTMDTKALVKAAKAYHKKLKTEGADKGTRVHTFVEQFVHATLAGEKDVTLNIAEDITLPVKGFMRWWADNKVVPKYTELMVWSEDGGGFAGTLDDVWKVNGRWYVVDIKTSDAIWPEMILQVAAYYHAFKQRFPKEKVKRAAFLRLDKTTGESEWVPLTEEELDHAYAKFKCLAMYVNLEEAWKARDKEWPS